MEAVFLLAAFLSQEGGVDFRLSIVEEGGSWEFVIEGRAPEGARLRGRVCAVDEGGEYPLDPEDRWLEVEPRDGSFRQAVWSSRRRPYSIRYRAVVRVAGREESAFIAEVRRGTDEDLERELEAAQAEAAEDLARLERLLKEGAPRGNRLRAIARRNAERWSLWAAWPERQARMRIGALCERMEEGALRGLQAEVDEAREVLGIDSPGAVAELRRWIGRYRLLWHGLADSEDGGRRARAREALLAMSAQKRMPRGARARVAALVEAFARIDGLRNREELPAAVAEHDRRLAELAAFAGPPRPRFYK